MSRRCAGKVYYGYVKHEILKSYQTYSKFNYRLSVDNRLILFVSIEV